jgi:hypothetical protein
MHQMDFVRVIDAAGIKPVIDRTFDLDEIVDAFRYEASGRHFGKICLVNSLRRERCENARKCDVPLTAPTTEN